MRLWMDFVFLALGASWKWLLAVVGALVLVFAGLFIAGVFGGESEASASTPETVVEEIVVPAPTTAPVPTPVPRATSVPAPEATTLPAPTAVLLPTVEVPVYLAGADNIGSLEFVLVYEPAVLEVANVEPGPMAQNALVEFGARTSGRLWAGLIDTKGLQGDGPVAIVSFNIVGHQPATSALRLEQVLAYDATSLLDVLAEVSAGSFAAESKAVTGPGLTFTP